jgi:hypothetical protein
MIFKALLSGRWLIAFMVLPYALLLTRAAGSGGTVTAFIVMGLLLFYFACLDELHTSRLDETRLGFIRQRGRIDPQAATTAKYLFGGIVKLLSIITLFFEPWVGIAGLAALTIIWLASLSTRRWQVKTLWSEILIPLCALMVPLIFVELVANARVSSRFETTPSSQPLSQYLGVYNGLVSPAVRLATVIGAGMLACYFLLCAMRDEPADRGDGLVTTVTMFGRARAGLAFFLIAAATAALTIRGSSAIVTYAGFEAEALLFAWPWSIAAFSAILAMFGVLLTAEREDALAVGIWGAGAIAIGVFFNLSVI